ncbi:MAG: phosphate/phosphite/phosphonate ABC transporter substrate-binding protein [Actinomycetota bacterium]
MARTYTRRDALRMAGGSALGLVGLSVLAACRPQASSEGAGPALPSELRFGVGPLQPTPDETKTAYDPFFKALAEEVGVGYQLQATTDWAGIAVAMANEQVDVAWMGPFGYVLANNDSGAQAIATAKYDDKPIYHAIVVGRPGLPINNWPQDAKGRSISFADVGSTSGWLIPTFWFKQQGIDPKTYFDYRQGATHAANEISVANGQVDLATDFDRNRNAMIDNGQLAPDATQIYWTSDPLPNDAIAVRPGLDPGLVERIRTFLVSMSAAEAKSILPNRYTGFVAADHSAYKSIEDAAKDLNAI